MPRQKLELGVGSIQVLQSLEESLGTGVCSEDLILCSERQHQPYLCPSLSHRAHVHRLRYILLSTFRISITRSHMLVLEQEHPLFLILQTAQSTWVVYLELCSGTGDTKMSIK